MTWLVKPSDTDVASAIAGQDWPACPPDFGYSRVRQTIRGENGDPLQVLPSDFSTCRIYAKMPLAMLPGKLRLRREVIARLVVARSLLPSGLSLVVLDGWRSLEFQTELVSYYSKSMASAVKDLYVSDPNDNVVAAPHMTGGAVDLTLQYEGQPLGLGSDFDAFDESAALDWLERGGSSELADEDVLNMRLRRCLAHTLSRCGFAHYPKEWWHWSYGDQWWAARYSRRVSLYSEVI